MPASPPRIAITMGDPAGVGAEVLVQALDRNGHRDRSHVLIIGHLPSLERAAQICDVRLAFKSISNPEEADDTHLAVPVLDPSTLGPTPPPFGEISAASGAAAVAFVETAAQYAAAGRIAAMVTCPIHKEAVHAAGFVDDIGHQEILARLTGATVTATMLMTQGLRVAHLSTHKSLVDACAYVTTENVLAKLRLTHDSLRQWGIKAPRIAVAALNPHGGEGGLLGREEIEELTPAVAEAVADGLAVVGPVPADSVFYRALAGEFDAVLALYHDQGHIAIKVHDFDNSITATMGIPFIRTSVDHGTAFDIAGSGKANPQSLEQALDAAVTLARGELRAFE